MGLTNKVIVFLGNTRFDSHIKATSLFIARNLAKDNQVFFVDYPFTLKDYYSYSNSDELKLRRKKFALSSDGLIDTDLPNLKIVITPPVLPINFLPEGPMFRTMLRLNESFIVSRLKKIFKARGIKEFIYINSFNFHYPNIARKIKPTLTVYQCVDPMIVPYDMKHGIKSEDQLVKQSDLVICTSKALFNQKKLQNKNTYFVPNASEVAHFSTALEDDLPVHEKLKDIPGPIVGYLGTIERRIDYDLVTRVATDNPHKSFVFAGPIWHDQLPKTFIDLPNVYILGPIPYDEIPQLVKGYDVAIIPFKKDEVSKTIFPLKLFEYLGAGRPVVVTDFNPDLKDYTADVVSYAANANEFTAAINDALATNSSEKVAKRVAVAKLNTWEKRTADIGDIISSHL
jgi:teichuronic acid biosynthesis glycosyltransferase TuaH